MAERAGCTDSKSSEHPQQTRGDRSASAGPVFVPKCLQHDRSLPESLDSLGNPKVTNLPRRRTQMQPGRHMNLRAVLESLAAAAVDLRGFDAIARIISTLIVR